MRNETGDENDVMPGIDGLRFLGILKKAVSWDFDLDKSSFFAAGCECVGWVSELKANAGRTVSIVKIVSLHVSKT